MTEITILKKLFQAALCEFPPIPIYKDVSAISIKNHVYIDGKAYLALKL